MKKSNWVAFVPFYLLTLIVFIGIVVITSKTVTTVNQNSPLVRKHRIIIDAGHGGIDGGATSCTGVLESRLNLEIALRLQDMMHLLGYETLMIRTTDVSIYTQGDTIAAQKVSDLKERVRIANETDGAILISIHQNTFPSSRYGGAQVFYGDVASRELAQSLQSNLVATINLGSKRKSRKSSGVYLMEQISCPGVLVECGFLSNPTEEAKLRDPAYQKQLCGVIGATLSRFANGKNRS